MPRLMQTMFKTANSCKQTRNFHGCPVAIMFPNRSPLTSGICEWEQKEGKKKMRQYGKVEIPQETFIAALKVDV